MLFKLSSTKSGRNTHCGVLEFVADEGKIYLPYWVSNYMVILVNCLKPIKVVLTLSARTSEKRNTSSSYPPTILCKSEKTRMENMSSFLCYFYLRIDSFFLISHIVLKSYLICLSVSRCAMIGQFIRLYFTV